MKFIRTFFILAVAVLGFSSIDAMAQSSSNQAIEKQIFKQVSKLPYYGIFDNISYQVEGSTVTLGGKVVRPTTKSDAKYAVGSIEGVTQVIDNIEVLPLSNFDDQIRYQVVNTLASRGGSFYRYLQGNNPSVHIIVEHGNVTLIGYVANKSDSNLANILTNGVFGVFNVENNLIVEGKIG